MHDIGKTFEADPKILHKEHERFNLKMSEKFLKSLNLSEEQLERLREVVAYDSNSLEMKIIKDADALALYVDKKLYTLYLKWARENNQGDAIQRKLEKFSKLYFEVSKKIGKKWFEKMKKDWNKL